MTASTSYRAFKTIADFVFALLLLPLLVLASLLLFPFHCLFFNGRLFFKQARQGYGGKTFYILKFRTMKAEFNAAGIALSEAQRMSAYGNFLRATKIDELPQILNILALEMSFVGPRPYLAKYNHLYTARQRKRFTVKPGISGYAQVKYGNNTDWATRLEADVYYAENQSLALDLSILLGTLNRSKESKQNISMPEFKGEHIKI